MIQFHSHCGKEIFWKNKDVQAKKTIYQGNTSAVLLEINDRESSKF